MVYVLYFLLFVVSFLIVLNGFLKGSKTRFLDTILGALLFVIIAGFFVFYDWKTGLLSVGVAFLFATIQYPFAKSLAARMLNPEWVDKNLRPLFERLKE